MPAPFCVAEQLFKIIAMLPNQLQGCFRPYALYAACIVVCANKHCQHNKLLLIYAKMLQIFIKQYQIRIHSFIAELVHSFLLSGYADVPYYLWSLKKKSVSVICGNCVSVIVLHNV